MHAEQLDDATEHRGSVGADAPGGKGLQVVADQGGVMKAAAWLGVGGIRGEYRRRGFGLGVADTAGSQGQSLPSIGSSGIAAAVGAHEAVSSPRRPARPGGGAAGSPRALAGSGLALQTSRGRPIFAISSLGTSEVGSVWGQPLPGRTLGDGSFDPNRVVGSAFDLAAANKRKRPDLATRLRPLARRGLGSCGSGAMAAAFLALSAGAAGPVQQGTPGSPQA